jgi:hypothetical protein
LGKESVRCFLFLDDGRIEKTPLNLGDGVLKTATIGVRPTKRQTRRDDELEKAIEQ